MYSPELEEMIFPIGIDKIPLELKIYQKKEGY
jgi:hypothetical protein